MATLDLTIETIGARGDGTATLNGGRVHVPLTAPGDRVRVRLLPGGRRGEAVRGELIELLSPGPDRADPVCPRFGVCGGCALQHLSTAAQAAWKSDLVRRELARVGLADAPIEPIVQSPPGTRRRVRFAVIRRGKVTRIGFNERMGKRIVDPDPCPVCAPELIRILPALRELLGAVVDEGKDVDAAVTTIDGALDVCLIGPVRSSLDARERLAAFAEANDLARLTVRARDGAPADPVSSRRPFAVNFAGATVVPPPGGFLQATPEGERALTEVVSEATRGAKRAADLFCGIGTFALPLALAGASVIAVENDGEATAALTAAARSRRLSVVKRDLFHDPLEGRELDGLDAVVFDPPRAGASEQAQALAASSVPVIVGVSCRPQTFARDARTLVDGGWELKSVRPVDQFPWSPHVELVAVFERRD